MAILLVIVGKLAKAHLKKSVGDVVMFSRNQFILDCLNAAQDGQEAIKEIVAEAVSDTLKVVTVLGEKKHAGIYPLYQF
ncbi:hypothetical protein [Photobacterium ganghwense]|uniref:hypothetical protein n=1 Tax=Photobacterium ganghwense TaxID=320778 RepID=UPI001C2D726D|nr:hypothetical protein [Photobacterium ganghwense]MBV1843527.1 hypothetical protein [Photobacterium ganghwense]